MIDIVRTEEGQRFFNFLDLNWSVIQSLGASHHANQIIAAIQRATDIEGEVFDPTAMEENEYDAIIHYFLTVGSSY